MMNFQGVLVKSEPFDACAKVSAPPEEPTMTELEIEEIDLNVTHIKKNNWFLIVDQGQCDIEIKIVHAFNAGYDALILLSSETELDKQEDLNRTSHLKIFSAKVEYNSGFKLIENYAYPEP